jgi:TetR/AcrR family transcriptional regulator, transcriptional repressor for nem operon
MILLRSRLFGLFLADQTVWYNWNVPRDGSATRERILRVAERLMTEQGYNATSVDQVIAGSSTSKGAFFHHFSSKADLAVQLVARYVASDLAHLDAGLAATADITDPTARVVAFLRFYEDGADELMSEQSGCLYATVLAEREFTGSDINAQIAKAELAWRTALADLLHPALNQRRTDISIDVAALADHLFTTFEGGFILCRVLQDPSAMRAQLRILRQLVEALLRVGRPHARQTHTVAHDT